TPTGSRDTSCPHTQARPASARSNVARMRTTVVLPAPLGPSNPNTVPAGTCRSTPSNAVVSPYLFTRPSVRIAMVSFMPPRWTGALAVHAHATGSALVMRCRRCRCHRYRPDRMRGIRRRSTVRGPSGGASVAGQQRVERGECLQRPDGQGHPTPVSDLRLPRVDAYQRTVGRARQLRLSAYRGYGQPGPDLHDDQRRIGPPPLGERVELGLRTVAEPVPITEHEDVGAGETSAVRTRRQRRPGPHGLVVHLHRDVV